ncbi:MAG: hypothetical protein WB951_21190 [Candidatus Sulfotelmatobacter sp.]|jgi:hypothetical protein
MLYLSGHNDPDTRDVAEVSEFLRPGDARHSLPDRAEGWWFKSIPATNPKPPHVLGNVITDT